MTENPPVIYILHGDDELGITQFVSALQVKLGDPVMDTIRLDGRTASFEELENAAATRPFFASRRLVIVTNPLAKISGREKTAIDRYKSFLSRIPDSAAFVMIFHELLTPDKDAKKNKFHWLEIWSREQGEGRVYLKAYPSPKGAQMTRRIQDMAQAGGGKIQPEAADLLGTLVGDDTRLAGQELEKLLAYVNYSRIVEVEDVEQITADYGHGDVFAMVDAIGTGDTKRALNMLHRLLEEQDAISIFGMIIRQFRLLLLAREVVESRGNAADAARDLKIHPYVAEKIMGQARRFSLPVLISIYHRLLELDLAMKTGETEAPLALDLLIAGVTLPAGSSK